MVLVDNSAWQQLLNGTPVTSKKLGYWTVSQYLDTPGGTDRCPSTWILPGY
eukprot:jgi/Botrbrau1/4932/Bobra.0122s0014.1